MVQVLVQRAGIGVPTAKLQALNNDCRTYCAQRFDRQGAGRRMYAASTTTLLERRDGQDGASYLDLAEFIGDHSATGHSDEDLAQMLRRVLFNVLVGNRDDHLRNHSFIRKPSGWRLSKAFDVNPGLAKAEHALTLDGPPTTWLNMSGVPTRACSSPCRPRTG